ncbi:hypothetical protein LCGC14_1585750 [marine sediment metagenome]|uniref:Uncharacterized protein n=1 Tax=marine sediment metagenome TaxID=412755 RepID=A0A0F9IFR4_9ZZZZ
MKGEWISPAPTECQLCHDPLKDSFIDGKTDLGPWGVMCLECHSVRGYGLGIGRGQQYDLKTLKKIGG